MYNDTQFDSKAIIKKILIVIVAVVAVALISFGVVFVLRIVKGQPAGSDQSQTQSSIDPQPDLIVTQYAVPSTIPALSEAAYNKQPSNDDTTPVYVKQSGKPYSVAAPTTTSVLFSAKSTSQSDDSKLIEQQTTAFLTPKGYTKADTTTPLQTYVTYTNNTVTCQLTPSPGAGTLSSYIFACISKAGIDKEYTAIEQLLALYKKSHPLAGFNQATRTTITEGDKSMSIVRLAGEKTHPALLFAAIGSDWVYVGDLSGEGNTSNGKYDISPDMQKIINDPKYGDFLKKNIH